tara:strand:- start:10321 stop:10716 length:396 start_codon:yes stop_codon:yes gene_type:complete
MTPELLAMLGGGVSGFIMKMIANQAETQARLFEQTLSKQQAADESANQASSRGGALMRRVITSVVLFAIVVVPTVVAFTDIGVSVNRETNGFFGLFKTVKWDQISGYVILPEVRQAALAIVGFYFGSSQVK